MNKEKRKVIVESYVGLVDVVVSRLLTTEKYRTFRHLKDELISEGYIGLIKAVDTFDPERKVKPVTYLSLYIRGRCQDYIKKYMREEGTQIYIPIEYVEIADKPEEISECDWDFIDKHEPKDQIDRRIYHEILMGNSTYRMIAEDFGKTPQSIRRKTQRLKQRLKDQIQKENN